VHIGNRNFLKRSNIVISDEVEQVLQGLEKDAKTAILVALNERVVGVIGISDNVKVDALFYVCCKTRVHCWFLCSLKQQQRLPRFGRWALNRG
jgi:hypothetical protein